MPFDAFALAAVDAGLAIDSEAQFGASFVREAHHAQRCAACLEGLPTIQPVFITIDPERDGPLQLKEYLADWHPKMIGLTGSPEKIAKACTRLTAATRALARAAPAPGAQQRLTRARGT